MYNGFNSHNNVDNHNNHNNHNSFTTPGQVGKGLIFPEDHLLTDTNMVF